MEQTIVEIIPRPQWRIIPSPEEQAMQSLYGRLHEMSMLFRGMQMPKAQQELYVRVLLASEDAPSVEHLLRTLEYLMTWWTGTHFPTPGHILWERRRLAEEGSL